MLEAMILCAALAQTEVVDAWFTPNSAGTKIRMSLSHAPRICCYEMYVDASVASNWDYEGFAPMDFFASVGMSYRVLEIDPGHSQYLCNGVGLALGSYYPDESLDAWTGIAGEFFGTPPFLFLPDGCVDPHPPIIVWDGTIPNYERPVDWWWTCPGDISGDGTVGIVDFLKLLGDWGLTNDGIPDFLDLIANWGPCA